MPTSPRHVPKPNFLLTTLAAVSVGLALTPLSAADGYRISLIDGTSIETLAIEINQQGNVTLSPSDVAVSLADVVTIEPIAADPLPSTVQAGSGTAFFASGGSISIADPAIAGDQLLVTAMSGITSIPIGGLRAIVWESSAVVTDLVQNPPSDNDAVLIRRSDQVRGIEGVVEGLDNLQVKIRYKGKSRKIALNKVTAIVMADLQLSGRKNAHRVAVSLNDGGSVSGTLTRWADQQLEVHLGGDAVLQIPQASLSNVTFLSDRIIYLSDLDPISAAQKSMFTLNRPWQRDRSVEGRPLTLFDVTQQKRIVFKKGIGTHSWSRLVFQNERGLDRFAATVGIDAETAGRGACRMVVRGDGIELWSADVTGVSGMHSVELDIEGIREVELEVIPGKDFDLADHANWCDARFLKTK